MVAHSIGAWVSCYPWAGAFPDHPLAQETRLELAYRAEQYRYLLLAHVWDSHSAEGCSDIKQQGLDRSTEQWGIICSHYDIYGSFSPESGRLPRAHSR